MAEGATIRQEEKHGLPAIAAERESLSESTWSDKNQLILKACQDHDVQSLIRCADSTGGLLSDDMRRLAWPILLGTPSKGSLGKQAQHQRRQQLELRPEDEEQVQKDVDRTFVYSPGKKSEEEIDAHKAMLYNLIIRTLRSYPLLCYFQGYHDITSVLLLVLGPEKAVDAVARISLLRIRDYMLTNIKPAVRHLDLIPAILQAVDSRLSSHLAGTKPFYALSATLTLYAHDIQEYGDIARLYDFVLAHEPLMTIYLFVAIIIWRRKELLDVPADEPEMLHFMLSKLPQPLDLDFLITQALDIFYKHPPESLLSPAWSRISSLSVLKTSRVIEKPMNLNQAQHVMKKQSEQLERTELWQKRMFFLYRNRYRIYSVAATLLVGGLSVWLRRSGNDRMLWVLMKRAIELGRQK